MVYDLLIRNGNVVDGTGGSSTATDVAIKDGKIDAMGNLSGEQAERTIEARGLVVTPGFIDIHNHSDFTVVLNPLAESYIRQGCTTLVVGNCGFSCYPVVDEYREELRSGGIIGYVKGAELNWHTLREYSEWLEGHGIGINVAPLVGHGAIRTAVMGFDAREPDERELRAMRGLVADAMEDGAFGFSSGLEYTPGSYAKTEELVDLCREMGRHGGFYATHTRDRNEKILESALEAMETARQANVPLQISHHIPRFPMEGLSKKCLIDVEKARRDGLDVTIDVFAPVTRPDYLPEYMWGSTTLTAMLPKEALEGGVGKLLDRLRDPAYREKIKNFEKPILRMGSRKYNQWHRIVIESSSHTPELVGRSIADIARERQQDPWDVVCDVLLANGEDCLNCFMTAASYSKEDGLEILRYRWTSVGSDGIALATYGPLKDVRFQSLNSYSCFPIVFEKYVREELVVSLEEMVRKCTSLPASRLGLRDRGTVAVGMRADLVVFDLASIRAGSTTTEPRRYPTGISFVILSGKIVLEGSQHTGEMPGRVLSRKDSG